MVDSGSAPKHVHMKLHPLCAAANQGGCRVEVGWRILRCGLASGLVLLFSVQRNVSIFTWSRYQDNEMIVPSSRSVRSYVLAVSVAVICTVRCRWC